MLLYDPADFIFALIFCRAGGFGMQLVSLPLAALDSALITLGPHSAQ
jgi:hypothetical protein